MNYMLRWGNIFPLLFIALQVSAQIYVETPGPYVNSYAVNSEPGSLNGDTTFWEHRTYQNGFLSLSEFRDTTWEGATPTQKVIYFGSLAQLDSVHYITINANSETLSSIQVYEYVSSTKYIERRFSNQGGVREETYRYTYFLDSQGRVIEEQTMSTDWQSGQLENMWKRTHHYTSAGQIETILGYSYDNGYELTDKYWYEYNASGKRSKDFIATIDNGNEVIDQRYDYFYDAQGNWDHVSHFFYDSPGSDYLSRYYELEHNEDGQVIFEREYDVVGPDTATQWYIGHERYWHFEGGLLVSSQFDMYSTSGPNRLIDYRYTYSSEVFPTKVEELNSASKLSISLFPNPCSDQLKISLDQQVTQVVVSSIQGEQVLAMSTHPSLETSIPTRSLASGTYVIQVTTEDGKRVRSTFVKE